MEDLLFLEPEQQAALMGAISDAVLAVDKKGKPLFYNTRFAVLVGKQALKTGTTFRDFFSDASILETYQTALDKGQTATTHSIVLVNESGKSYFSLSVSPLQNGAVGIFHDVTDLKRAEQMRIDFVANVSHELRTPLTAIKGYADTLLDDATQGRPIERPFLESIVRNTGRLMNLINDLLDLSSLESTEVIHAAETDTQELTSRILSQMQNAFERKNQKATLQIDAPFVFADSKRIEQVLVNLIDNASKYTPAGGKIHVSWEQGKDHKVLLKVKDTGPGIPLEHHARLFERFYRVDKARSREQGGTGLGLAIVKHILQRHGGTVSIESTVGQGATFICEFPG